MSLPFTTQAINNAVFSYTRPADLTYPDPNETAMYKLTSRDFEFDPEEDYRAARFAETLKVGVLYRPEIVKALQNVVFSPENEKFGVVVRGPHGVGKSHSLVNFVHTLRGDGHIVTFIPDCERWHTTHDFVEAICRSLGTTMEQLGFTAVEFSQVQVKLFVRTVAGALKRFNNENKQADVRWILVVDQLNRIFGRKIHENLKDIGVLPIPFSLMKTLNTFPHVHVVVSASANNSTSYRENHEGFREYDHPLFMNEDEVTVWKPEFEGRDKRGWRDIMDATGGCPFQIYEFLRFPSRKEYESDAVGSIYVQTIKLLKESDQRECYDITTHALYCLLAIPVSSPVSAIYDKKYSVLSGGFVQPTFPAVLVAYRKVFWEELMDYVEKNEAQLLSTCANPHVTNDVRGRLFELVVISRFRKESVISNQPAMDVLPERVDRGMVFDSQQLPPPTNMLANKLFIPKNSNFPAIDLILKEGNDVWAVQVHVADHENVEPTFRSMCEDQDWFQAFDNIYLVYLSPSQEVTDSLRCLPAVPSRTKRPRLAKPDRPPIQVSAISKDDIVCLMNIQWPNATPEEYMDDTL